MATVNLATSLQRSLFGDVCPISDAVQALSVAEAEQRGAVYTRREVVDFMLDLVGYEPSAPLHTLRALEPSFGDGDFLFPMIERLLAAWQAYKGTIGQLANALRGIELHRETFDHTKDRVLAVLKGAGLLDHQASAIADVWLRNGDFLLSELDGQFDFVTGNPPYVRQEMIADALIAEYRRRYPTIFDRADIYVPFIERSLQLLDQNGQLCFICADRWMKNRYGARLRALVANQYLLKTYVDMVDTPAFHSDVIAYPAITVIARETGNMTRMAYRPEINEGTLSKLAKSLRSPTRPDISTGIREVKSVTVGAEPWLLDAPDKIELLRRLEREFPTIEDAGCKVGIGVATGADKAFIGAFDQLDVEPDRKLPLATTRDIASGKVVWTGLGIINPFSDDGDLVRLSEFPKLSRFLEDRRELIAGRHVAKKAPSRWFRTIDRIYPDLAKKPKLLIPDIKGDAHIVYEEGNLYPHHNLYYVVSEDWDLRALQAVLKSAICKLFIETYSTKMRGGFLRFQAQYIRRIRLPLWKAVDSDLRARLLEAGRSLDTSACDEAAFDLYGLSADERKLLEGADTANGLGPGRLRS